jgi:glucose/arabinose dehydrogenase
MEVRICVLAAAWWFGASASASCDGVPARSGSELRLLFVTGAIRDPVDATAPPNDTGRLFVVEQAGRIWIVDLADDSVTSTPFLDIRSRIAAGGERGLLGLAFHPGYAENGHFFVSYTRSGDGDSVVARYTVSPSDPARADAASERVLLVIDQPFANHNGGQIAFGPLDGYLYLATGDGGSGGDPGNRAQDPNQLLGKILRIDVDGGDPYSIPPSNPFAGDDGVRDEIWALGLRNPWRFAFDRETGDMIVADVGQGAWEEINFQSAAWAGGANYEWRVREGNHPYSATTAFGPGTRVPPVLEYPHAGSGFTGCSVTGGRLYRGCSMPDLHGTYFFADYCAGWIRSLAFDGGVVRDLRDRTAELNANLAGGAAVSITSFGEDGRGEL